MVLQYIISENLHRLASELKIVSDSQTSVGILTLNWNTNHYLDLIRDIKEAVDTLRSKGLGTNIIWTPGHANIDGNTEADLLAKNGAKEAQDLNPEDNIVTTQDIKQAARKSVVRKWQRRWEISERGRDLYDKVQNVKIKVLYDYPSKALYNILTQLRTGYTKLKDYQHKTGISDDPNCTCGEKETVNHYLLECQLYETERQEMLKQINMECGIRNINIGNMLTQLPGENTEETKTKLNIITKYIKETGRFNADIEAIDGCPTSHPDNTQS